MDPAHEKPRCPECSVGVLRQYESHVDRTKPNYRLFDCGHRIDDGPGQWWGFTLEHLVSETTANMSAVPGWEGAVGPFPGQYGHPHVYARDVHSGAGNCVCGRAVGHRRHVQAAPGVPIPDDMRQP